MDKENIVQVSVGDLEASKWNRADLGNGELKELAGNVKADGILVPLIVRTIEDGYEIVAGHRRWQAAKIAGLKQVPCIIRTLTDEEAKRTQVIENLHRKNLNPIEEAEAFKQLWKPGLEGEAQRIAEIIGKDAKYVYRALELLRLPAKAQKALKEGTISAAHGHQLARVGPSQIEAIAAYAITEGYKGEVPSLVDLKAEIGRRVEKKLSAAPFEKLKPYAGKIACKGCPSNTANQDMLFDDAEEGFCTNNTCFAAKLKQFYKDLQAKGQERWPTLHFVGTATTRYGNTQVIKGYQVVEAGDPHVQKAIKEEGKNTPSDVAKYGFGILKPSSWGTSRVAKLVALKKMAKGEAEKTDRQGYHEPTDEERAMADFRDAFIRREIAIVLFTKGDLSADVHRAIITAHLSDQWAVHRCTPWLNAAGFSMDDKWTMETLKQQVRGLKEPQRLSFWLMSEGGNSELDDLVAEANEIDLPKEKKRALGLAAEHWKEHHDSIVDAYKKRRNQ
jgi:ParB/RepB/Spo0J family partition protein